MTKIKLPKQLFKVLFPKSRKSSSSRSRTKSQHHDELSPSVLGATPSPSPQTVSTALSFNDAIPPLGEPDGEKAPTTIPCILDEDTEKFVEQGIAVKYSSQDTLPQKEDPGSTPFNPTDDKGLVAPRSNSERVKKENDPHGSTIEVELEAKKLPSPVSVIARDGFPVSQAGQSQAVTKSEQKPSSTQFFILLLCPKSHIFELLEIADAPKDSTVYDILQLMLRKCTDERLLEKKYIGLCRPSDRTEFLDLDAAAFKEEDQDDDWVSHACIREDDVLVAILKGSTGYQMGKISKRILQNDKFKTMIRGHRLI